MKSNLICYILLVITVCVYVTHGKIFRSDLKIIQKAPKNDRKTVASLPNNFATRNGSSDPELNKRVAQLTR